MKIKFQKKDLYTIPNILSYIRLLLIPVVVVIYINAKDTNDYFHATLLFVICAMTDLADGYIARRFNQITDLGKILDPIADKFMQAAVLVCLVIHIPGLIPAFILFAVKEIFMGIAGLVFLQTSKKLVGAKWFGKICTVVLDVSMVVLFAFPNLNAATVNAFITIIMVFMIFSLAMYAFDYFILFRKK